MCDNCCVNFAGDCLMLDSVGTFDALDDPAIREVIEKSFILDSFLSFSAGLAEGFLSILGITAIAAALAAGIGGVFMEGELA